MRELQSARAYAILFVAAYEAILASNATAPQFAPADVAAFAGYRVLASLFPAAEPQLEAGLASLFAGRWTKKGLAPLQALAFGAADAVLARAGADNSNGIGYYVPALANATAGLYRLTPGQAAWYGDALGFVVTWTLNGTGHDAYHGLEGVGGLGELAPMVVGTLE